MVPAAALILVLSAGRTTPAEPAAVAPAVADGATADVCGVIVAIGARVSVRNAVRLRAHLAPVLAERGLVLVDAATLAAQVQRPSDPGLGRCLDNNDCLVDLALRLGASRLLLIRMERKGRRYGAAVRYWDDRAASEWHVVAPVRKKAFNAAVAGTVVAASAEWEVRRAEAAAARVPTPDVALEPIGPGRLRPTSSLHEQLVTAVPEAVDDTSRFGFEVGASVALYPIAHRATRLVVARNVGGNGIGGPAFGLVLRLRPPYLPVEELYVTVAALFALDDPLLVLGVAAGLEKRWQLANWAPLVGARYSLGFVGLPIPADGGVAMALSHGVEVFAGAAFGFAAVPLRIVVNAGFRFCFNRLNQFAAGGHVYYARDATTAVWIVDLSGPVAALSVAYAY